MGKAHKKNKDFKKIKLKIGKKLKKPNETSTDFNAHKVVLFKQLNASSKVFDIKEADQVLSHRQLNIKELCQRMRHHNANVRKDAVASLKQLVTRQSEDQLRANLKLILESCLALISDLDQDVRSVLFGLLKEICAKAKPLDFSPNFSLLVAHIVCASTHFNSAVRLFAVKIVGLLLETLPDLVRGNAKLLKSYADSLKFREKNLSRASKSAMLSGLHSILKIIYSQDFKCLKIERKPQQNNRTNPTCCSLTGGLSNLFDFSIYSSSFNSFGDGLENDQTTLINVAEKSMAFCHAFWLEITTVDLGNPTKCSEGVEKFFDADTILDMERVLNIYRILFDRMKDLNQEMSMLQCDSANRIRFDLLAANYFKNDKVHDHYAVVFPCLFQRGAVNQVHITNACQKINLLLWEIFPHRLNKQKIVNYVEKLKLKQRLPDDLLDKLNALSDSL